MRGRPRGLPERVPDSSPNMKSRRSSERSIGKMSCARGGRERAHFSGQRWGDSRSSADATGADVMGSSFQAWRDQISSQQYHLGRGVASVTSAEHHAAVHFDDGSVERGDIVLGADGIGSAVRSFVAPESRPHMQAMRPFAAFRLNEICRREARLCSRIDSLSSTRPVRSISDIPLPEQTVARCPVRGVTTGSGIDSFQPRVHAGTRIEQRGTPHLLSSFRWPVGPNKGRVTRCGTYAIAYRTK